ncbi:MAG: YfhO family protein [Candidatus Saccharibacteria bacterium]|nr:YfhO family protein [Candidatus Saccharibacteria bacterium]
MKNRKAVESGCGGKKKNVLAVVLASFLVAIVTMVGICVAKKIVPFGEKSLAYVDATIQYVDFFSWGKDIAEGKAQINYDLSKVLGGNTVAVFSYYLTSPFSFLLLLFNKDDFQIYFTLMMILKVGLAAASMTWFLRKRINKIQNYQVVVLACGYALSGWMFYNFQNQMWIDAMIMYPLLCYEVTRLVREGRGARLAILTTVTLIVNWYAGIMALIGMGIWWLYESSKNEKLSWRGFGRLIGTVTIGGMAAGFLIIPTMAGLMMGRGGVDSSLKSILGFGRLYNPLNLLEGFLIGGKIDNGHPDLYVGLLTGLLVGWMLLEKKKYRERRFEIGLIAIVFLIHLLPPLIWLFGLGRFPGGVVFRYSFVGLLPLIFVAGKMWSETMKKEKVGKMVGGMILGILAYEFCGGTLKGGEIWVNIAMMVGWGVILAMNEKRLKSGLAVALAMMELGVNGILCAKIDNGGVAYGEYIRREEELIEKIKEMDGGEYRIHNLVTRGDELQYPTLTANYNEALAFNYNSVSGYTSSPDERVRILLEKMGYNRNGENMNITNSSIIGTDSILGVKYILDDRELAEYEKVFSDEKKTVYENPYALPMAMGFLGDEKFNCKDEKNPFWCQNKMLSEISGRKTEIYREIKIEEENGKYIIPETSGAVYMIANGRGEIYRDGKLETQYGVWLAPKTVRVDGKISVSEGISDVKFYQADLVALAEAREKILTGAEMTDFQDGGDNFRIKVNVSENVSKILVTIPQDGNFRVLVNGREVQAEKFMNTLMVVPVLVGENEIVLEYKTPGVMAGVVISAVGILGEMGIGWRERKRKVETRICK